MLDLGKQTPIVASEDTPFLNSIGSGRNIRRRRCGLYYNDIIVVIINVITSIIIGGHPKRGTSHNRPLPPQPERK